MKTYFKAAKLMTEKADAEETLEDVMEVGKLILRVNSKLSVSPCGHIGSSLSLLTP